MIALSRANLAAGKIKVESTSAVRGDPVRILQIGDGNFLRAFADWMVDVINGAGLFNGEVTVVQPLDHGIADRLNAQEGLFTVLLRGVKEGREVKSRRLVTCVKAALNPYQQWRAFLHAARDPLLRFVISNTTEAGIAYLEEALTEGVCPQSFPAKVAALLWTRFRALGSGARSGLVFLPCELIEANGSNLRECVLRQATAWGLPAEFQSWVKEQNVFCNTLVDRIVTGFPSDEAEKLYAEFGYLDPLTVAGESFHLWVIEGPAQIAEELPLQKAGLEVIWTGDLQPYRTRKVRILNGAHTASVLAAFCSGLDTVKSMIEDPVVSRFLSKAVFDEIVPFVPLPDAERLTYAESVLERFANPHIRHELLSIALNSVSKWRVRVLPTVKDYAAARGKAPARLSFSLAALLRFYQGTFNAAGEYVGQCEGRTYPIRDNSEVLSIFEAVRTAGGESDGRVRRLLTDNRLWGEDLTGIPWLAEQTSGYLARIQAVGIKAALAEVG